jgi:hypothetical protein
LVFPAPQQQQENENGIQRVGSATAAKGSRANPLVDSANKGAFGFQKVQISPVSLEKRATIPPLVYPPSGDKPKVKAKGFAYKTRPTN